MIRKIKRYNFSDNRIVLSLKICIDLSSVFLFNKSRNLDNNGSESKIKAYLEFGKWKKILKFELIAFIHSYKFNFSPKFSLEI